jgi:hypothetical protein
MWNSCAFLLHSLWKVPTLPWIPLNDGEVTTGKPPPQSWFCCLRPQALEANGSLLSRGHQPGHQPWAPSQSMGYPGSQNVVPGAGHDPGGLDEPWMTIFAPGHFSSSKYISRSDPCAVLQNLPSRTGDLAQVVDHLPGKHEALSSTPGPAKG